MITVKTQIKEVVKDTGLGINNISEDFVAELDEKVKELVKEACKRAKENGRRTVMGKDV
jgi:histone H3/H4